MGQSKKKVAEKKHRIKKVFKQQGEWARRMMGGMSGIKRHIDERVREKQPKRKKGKSK